MSHPEKHGSPLSLVEKALFIVLIVLRALEATFCPFFFPCVLFFFLLSGFPCDIRAPLVVFSFFLSVMENTQRIVKSDSIGQPRGALSWIRRVGYFLNEHGFSVEYSSQGSSSNSFLWKRNVRGPERCPPNKVGGPALGWKESTMFVDWRASSGHPVPTNKTPP